MPKYHVLLTRESASSPWGIAFGDYDRANVVAEKRDCTGNPRDNPSYYRAANLKIVTSNSARQRCINWIVAELNNPTSTTVVMPDGTIRNRI